MEQQDRHMKLMAPLNNRGWSPYDKTYMTLYQAVWDKVTVKGREDISETAVGGDIG